MIYLTEKATAKIKEFADAEGIKPSVRVRISSGGCAGFSYGLDFEEIAAETDEIIVQDGIQMIIDQMSFHYLEDTMIDYLESEFGEGFKFSSGSIKSTCGCGKSVSF